MCDVLSKLIHVFQSLWPFCGLLVTLLWPYCGRLEHGHVSLGRYVDLYEAINRLINDQQEQL